VLLAHPAGSEAGVAGVPDPVWGARVAAWIVPRPGGAPPSPEALEAFCRARLAGFKVPRIWRFVETLPRNGTGKLLRRALPDLAGAA
jgi:acyl-CoA synthetase (AMP-forming)/AMP-acid ligase II